MYCFERNDTTGVQLDIEAVGSALKFTPAGRQVILRAYQHPFQPSGEQRGSDRTHGCIFSIELPMAPVTAPV